MTLWTPDMYTKAWNFAADAHRGQRVPGTERPYINHLGNVAMEVMRAIAATPTVQQPDLAVQCALLHDTIEDTAMTYGRLVAEFGPEVAAGVLALSKDSALPKEAQMADSLQRIRQQPEAVWMVKLADRISNLQKPPKHWGVEKIRRYGVEAEMILEALGEANAWLAQRLAEKIVAYGVYGAM
ncbi:bifunctional (p)ppGpp synthetase/guanosine-3',5'-bis(diphosphate) 3'-pyrophosphohydrolase [Leptolyngbyaceae cyanobacterium CCMR0082]|uniref:Bifunctional (P)ppGpp synthetase/guanosine-3',5'-bis(Diphosphate) 3'-pyrophosphohydrolase n=1 Tax=Adonisia turfae CCMR0082 TaxID=2304604 RepID=A0A6M0S544_9CYAN|nr:HD domain-containing protein [Adonisia turfae]NEZ63460.1 bifunctional (p)ppGpp synthetase/guanosine-3',5'-bis(diphosphate) 3'-pyrophosphohydrolase [Adonisia turfae CCMR0082]